MIRAFRILATIPLALAFYALLLFLGTMSLGWSLIAMVLHPVLPERQRLRVGRAGISWGYRLFWSVASACRMMRIDARCLDALRDEPGVIFVANHPTMLDAMLLVAHLPKSACIMKASLMKNIFLGAGARLARYIRNDSARVMVRLAVDDLRDGGQLVIFPEGTRTVKAPLNEFLPGVTLIAKLAQAPIQTVFIDTDSPYLGKGWPLWRVPPLPVVFKLRLGQRFSPCQDSAALLTQLDQYFRHHVEQRQRDEIVPDECQTSPLHTLF
jgi:1-acyl-sn-glycerol-3-phosphate acyltransferase